MEYAISPAILLNVKGYHSTHVINVFAPISHMSAYSGRHKKKNIHFPFASLRDLHYRIEIDEEYVENPIKTIIPCSSARHDCILFALINMYHGILAPPLKLCLISV